QARDAANLVELDYEPLPGVSDPEAALAPGAPVLHDEFGTNLAFEVSYGSPLGDIDEAFRKADHIGSFRIQHNRLAAVAIEPRGITASWDPQNEQLDIWMSTQRPQPNREEFAKIFGLDIEQVHVICQDVGGAFGSKSMVYREHVL